MRRKYRFVVVEGVDGVGKTTIAKALSESCYGMYEKTPLRRMRRVALFFERFNSPEIETVSYLTLGVITGLYFRIVLRRRPIVCDKYILTTIVAQRALGGRLVQLLERIRYLLLPKPDYTFCLTVETEEDLRERFRKRDYVDASDEQLMPFWINMQNAFCSFPEVTPVNTSGRTPSEVKKQIEQYMSSAHTEPD